MRAVKAVKAAAHQAPTTTLEAKLKQQVAALKQQVERNQGAAGRRTETRKEQGRHKYPECREDGRRKAEKVLAGYSSSHYQPAQRQPSGKGAGDNVNVVEEGKNAIKERLAKLHKKGKK